MNKVGTIKNKLLTKLTESYSTNNKTEIKELLTTINKNKNFKDVYLFYEEVENKYFDDAETAKLYVENVESLLSNQMSNENKDNLKSFCDSLDKKLGDLEYEKNELYESLDILSEKNTLSNIEKKIAAKKFLYDYLTKKKDTKEINKDVYNVNENLLYTVLTNNFNVLYNNTLNENEKESLKEILSMTNEDLTIKTKELKETIAEKISTLLNESSDTELKTKLTKVKDEIEVKEISRINYLKLTELKNGLN